MHAKSHNVVLEAARNELHSDCEYMTVQQNRMLQLGIQQCEIDFVQHEQHEILNSRFPWLKHFPNVTHDCVVAKLVFVLQIPVLHPPEANNQKLQKSVNVHERELGCSDWNAAAFHVE